MQDSQQTNDFLGKAGQKLRRHWRAIVVAGAITVGAGAWRSYQIFDHYRDQALKAPADPNADAIVVLTGGPGRIKAGFELCGPQQKLLVSGCDPRATFNILCNKQNVDRSVLRLNPANVTLGTEALNTYGNAVEIESWLKQNPDIDSIVIVTSYAHAARTCMELGKRLEDEGVTISYHLVGDPENTISFKEVASTVWRSAGLPAHTGTRTERDAQQASFEP